MHRKTTRRQVLSASAAALGSAIALSACTSESPTGESPTDEGVVTRQPEGSDEDWQTSAQSFPVGNPFGEPAWSLDRLLDHGVSVAVRGDRLIVENNDNPHDVVYVFDSKGQEVWHYELPSVTEAPSLAVRILNETVAILIEAEAEAEGLKKPTKVANVLLLSIDDGSVRAEADLPVEDVGYPPENLIGDGVHMTENGDIRDLPAGATEAAVIDGVLIWNEKSEGGSDELLSTENWRNARYHLSRHALVNQQSGLILVNDNSSGGDPLIGHILDVHTGEIRFPLSSDNNPGAESHGTQYWNPRGGQETSVTSPNGEYAISGALWISASEGRCIGGGDNQQAVVLTAVDDAGTAYGISEEGRLVVVPNGGDARVSDLPEVGPGHKPAPPFAVMAGGLALHWDGVTITANPIK